MTDLFLIRLIGELLRDEKPSADEIKCVRKIIEQILSQPTPLERSLDQVSDLAGLDDEAQEARKDLLT